MRIQRPGIEWVNVFGPGATLNVTGGCQHGCRWQVGEKTVICYAEATANRFRREAKDGHPGFYENGFDAHYFHPERLNEPERVKRRMGIFIDSMSDLYGAWVPEAHIKAVHDMCRRAHWHVLFSLTKNPARMATFGGDLPDNLWSGFSSPPDQFEGRVLSRRQRERMFEVGLKSLERIKHGVRWVSLEPLTFDAVELLKGAVLDWAVVGAATDGARAYQPDPLLLRRTLDVLDQAGVPVFMKGNLRASQGVAFDAWRQEYPPIPEAQA